MTQFLMRLPMMILILIMAVGSPSCSSGSSSGMSGQRIPVSQDGSLLGGRSSSTAFDSSRFSLNVPVASGGGNSTTEIFPPALASYQSEYFEQQNGELLFMAPVGGPILGTSQFPRTELRELTPTGERAFWDSTNGVHSLSIRAAVTTLPPVHPAIVVGQIHDAKEYVVLIRLDGTMLYVKAGDKNVGVLDENYRLGQYFAADIIVRDGSIVVTYNGETKVVLNRACIQCYFKSGAYLQTSPGYGDNPNSVGRVRFTSIVVRHS